MSAGKVRRSDTYNYDTYADEFGPFFVGLALAMNSGSTGRKICLYLFYYFHLNYTKEIILV